MNYTYRQIWLINYPVMLSILMEQLINITDAVFLGHVGEVELGASALGSIYYKEGRTETAMEHIPEYLRISQAERERAEREKEQKPAGTKI